MFMDWEVRKGRRKRYGSHRNRTHMAEGKEQKACLGNYRVP